mmetsp:Transcript_40468/g.128941  ORF Transcript_40468/g.128941 Transcript_40468/m.128941 type:complete len:248 (+) Transcript_40468:650-1393(+)
MAVVLEPVPAEDVIDEVKAVLVKRRGDAVQVLAVGPLGAAPLGKVDAAGAAVRLVPARSARVRLDKALGLRLEQLLWLVAELTTSAILVVPDVVITPRILRATPRFRPERPVNLPLCRAVGVVRQGERVLELLVADETRAALLPPVHPRLEAGVAGVHGLGARCMRHAEGRDLVHWLAGRGGGRICYGHATAISWFPLPRSTERILPLPRPRRARLRRGDPSAWPQDPHPWLQLSARGEGYRWLQGT